MSYWYPSKLDKTAVFQTTSVRSWDGMCACVSFFGADGRGNDPRGSPATSVEHNQMGYLRSKCQIIFLASVVMSQPSLYLTTFIKVFMDSLILCFLPAWLDVNKAQLHCALVTSTQDPATQLTCMITGPLLSPPRLPALALLQSKHVTSKLSLGT